MSFITIPVVKGITGGIISPFDLLNQPFLPIMDNRLTRRL
ncbi:hypothetical protein GECvBGOT_gp195c [Salmonella phage GEC_vB_GOT]|nr:hypothetical protein GECvBGOT_gp195c [Salmonella phage GEC_vB_GOT]